jgi:hypothetical protein
VLRFNYIVDVEVVSFRATLRGFAAGKPVELVYEFDKTIKQ